MAGPIGIGVLLKPVVCPHCQHRQLRSRLAVAYHVCGKCHRRFEVKKR